MPKVSGFCRECGKAIEYWPSQDRQFCSHRCKGVHRQRTNPLPTGQKKRRGITTPCETCGSPVYANQSARAKGQGRYCSKVCHSASLSKPTVVKKCETCGKELRLKPSQAARRYCSTVCMGLGTIRRPLKRIHNGKPARLDRHGYVLVWEPDESHGLLSQKGWVYEHRLVASRVVGRPLTTDEQVDHINRDRADNRPENLQVLDGLAHSAKTAADNKQDRIDLAEYRKRYGRLNR